jgi:hypothetical protein
MNKLTAGARDDMSTAAIVTLGTATPPAFHTHSPKPPRLSRDTHARRVAYVGSNAVALLLPGLEPHRTTLAPSKNAGAPICASGGGA